MTTHRKVMVFIAMSLDGYIAGPDDDLSFLSAVETEGEDYGYELFYSTIDTVIVGRKTFEKICSLGVQNPYIGKKVYVITRTIKKPEGYINYYSEPLTGLIRDLKNEPGKHIYCDGGAEIVGLLLNELLVDELIISVIPVLLGQGTRLFDHLSSDFNLQLLESKPFESGLVQLHYKVLDRK